MMQRAKTDAVFERAASFLSEMWINDRAACEMHVGDLAWGTYHRWPTAFDALRLWYDDARRPQALTMFDGTGVCDLVVRPGPSGLEAAGRALTWAELTCREMVRGSSPAELQVGRRVQSAEVAGLLCDRGFERCATGIPAMSRALPANSSAAPAAPMGYSIRELEPRDISSRVAAHNAAFPGAGLCSDAYWALRDCPAYISRLDVVAIAPGSTVAAFATLWLDPANKAVQIEPAGCLPEHRRRGLTHAVILEGLQRSAELGAEQALVRHLPSNVAAKALYEACGFTTVCTDAGFAKRLA